MYRSRLFWDSEEQATQIADLTQRLSQATQPQNQSLLPNDLEASTEILSAVVDILETDNITNNVRIVKESKMKMFLHGIQALNNPHNNLNLCTECY